MSPPASEPPLTDPNATPNKRRKTQLACNPCRGRKTGCDGQRPYCSSCVMRGWQDKCKYPETVSHAAPTLADLDRRLQSLEENAQSQARIDVPVTKPFDEISADFDNVPKNGHGSQDTNLTFKEAIVQVDSAFAHNPSSNTSFVQQVASVVGSDFKAADNAEIGTGPSISLHFPADYNVRDLVLPPRQFCDTLLQCYWELFHPIYPILHQPTFHASYIQLFQPSPGLTTHGTHHDVVFYSTLNIVLALGCQCNEALEVAEREELVSEFYRRSAKLVSLDGLDLASLQIVQLMLLRGFYLLYTPYANRCFYTVGIALRVAQAIGLQTAQPLGSSQLMREMRRRVWHICVFLDWMASLAFDRPAMLSDTTPIPLPIPIDDEYLSETNEGKQPHNLPSRLSFLTYAMKLVDTRRKMGPTEPQNVYNNGTRYSGQELGATLDALSGLDRFLEDLPPYLQCDHPFTFPPAAGAACFRLQARVLKSRVMYVRLKVLRPLVVAEANRCIRRLATSRSQETPNSAPNVQVSLHEDLCTLCVSTAHDALEEVHDQLYTVYRSSPWHNLYYTFAAASVIVAGILCPYLELTFDQGRCKTSWDRALAIFEFHKIHVASAEKGIQALERFKSYIETRQVITQGTVGPQVAGDVESTPDVDLGFFAPPMASDLNVPGHVLPDTAETFDFTPMDESWLLSQNYDFVDSLIQWH